MLVNSAPALIKIQAELTLANPPFSRVDPHSKYYLSTH